MAIQEKNKINYCLNCDRDRESYPLKKGYCSKCYPLILKIEKVKKGILLPKLFELYLNNDAYCNINAVRKEYILQLEGRLEVIKKAYLFDDFISAHDLELEINSTIRHISKSEKDLGKINDPIAFYLKDDKARAYVCQLFNKIKLLKPFKVNYDRLFEAAKMTKNKSSNL